jgi:hypothetical protein
MSRARTVARDETTDLSGLVARPGGGDPVEALVERVRPSAGRAVDALQVAASLEAGGLTDRAARVQYGYPDVFDLAEEVHRRVGPAAGPPPPARPRRRAQDLRDMLHGALYLVPAVMFPPALAALGGRSWLLAIVLAGAIGWIWSGTSAWLAYQLLGAGHPGSAARLLRAGALAALPVTALAAAVTAGALDLGYGVVVLAVAQLAHQMAVTLLVFYRREGLALAAMTPASVAGLAYLAGGRPLLPVAVGFGVVSVALALGLAVEQATHRVGGGGPAPVLESVRGRPLVALVAYTALSAAYFLYPQARHLADRLDVAVGLLPLLVGMGVVEWQARRFAERARWLLTDVAHPREFAVRVWRLLAGGLAVCLLTVATLALGLLAFLAGTGQVSPAGMVMAATGVLLAGAYYLGFLLANLGRYGWLCASLLGCLAGYAAAVTISPLWTEVPDGTLNDTLAYLGATALLVGLYLVALAGCVGQARRHR